MEERKRERDRKREKEKIYRQSFKQTDTVLIDRYIDRQMIESSCYLKITSK